MLSPQHRDPRRSGVLTGWNDQRGFGFIQPTVGGARLFVHVSAFPRGRRPADGSRVTYAEGRDERNRPCADQVRYEGRAPAGRTRSTRVLGSIATATGFFGILALLVHAGQPIVLLGVYGVLSVLALVLYGDDKAAARQGRWRVSESTLHLVALAGGWPGALIARHAFRHKTVKQPFRTVFWLTVTANVAALAAWVLRAG